MDRHTIRVLEYGKVLGLVARYAVSDPGKKRVLGLTPLDDTSRAGKRLRTVSELRLLHDWGKVPPLANVDDVASAVSRARVPGAVLDAKTLVGILGVVAAARLLRRFFEAERPRAPLVWDLASGLKELADLEREIDSAIDEDTNIKDGASPRLRKIRQEKARVSAKISSTLSDILSRESLRTHLQDNLITIRNGRYVIPVRAESRSRVSGIVHDTSQSGATVFVEPMETVSLNNTLRSLEVDEREEIVRILSGLTDMVRLVASEILADLEITCELDALTASARFAVEFACTEPTLSGDGTIDLRGGRHPVLVETQRVNQGEAVVPLDLAVGGRRRGLLITGPNAGGKTVALKTVGILTLMARTGLHVPAMDGTVIAPFRKVYADIGDEQSIELSLSTFSSHMRNTIEVLNEAGEDTLVLMDEIGAGTDPVEGAALARAVIQRLLDKGSTVVATTHHTDLKVFAHDSPLVENASMEFDSEGLRPTYRLIQGVPGASHALEIASRLGLDSETLSLARAFCGGERLRLEDLTRDLVEKMKRVEAEEATAESKMKKAATILSEYEARLDDIRKHDRELRKRALKEARSIVDDARRTADRLVKELRAEEKPEAAKAVVQEIRREAVKIDEAIEQVAEPGEHRAPLPSATAGMRVFVKCFAQEGVVLAGPDGRGRVQVVVGPMRAEVGMGDLFEVEPRAEETRQAGVRFEARMVPAELDVRGMTAEDAWEIVDRYVDDAALYGYPFVRIIHGKGKGILAKRLGEMLASHPRAKGHRFGEAGEGGTGVTIVELEKD